MRLAALDGRLHLLTADGPVDVATASDGTYGPDPQDVYERWEAFAAWAAPRAGGDGSSVDLAAGPAEVGSPVPRPRQVFAVGLNYRDHAAEAGLEVPDSPLVFTKFLTSLAGPYADLVLPSERVDWEVELVAVIGRTAREVAADAAWDHVAGLCVGQDYSERRVQSVGGSPQFSLGKSFPGFGPLGPWLVTPDELADRDDLRLTCTIDGESVQDGRTRDMVFGVAELVARLSAVTTLLPGDVVFTGTPAGVGIGRRPKRFLRPGEVVESGIEGLGTMRQTCVAAARPYAG